MIEREYQMITLGIARRKGGRRESAEEGGGGRDVGWTVGWTDGPVAFSMDRRCGLILNQVPAITFTYSSYLHLDDGQANWINWGKNAFHIPLFWLLPPLTNVAGVDRDILGCTEKTLVILVRATGRTQPHATTRRRRHASAFIHS